MRKINSLQLILQPLSILDLPSVRKQTFTGLKHRPRAADEFVPCVQWESAETGSAPHIWDTCSVWRGRGASERAHAARSQRRTSWSTRCTCGSLWWNLPSSSWNLENRKKKKNNLKSSLYNKSITINIVTRSISIDNTWGRISNNFNEGW